MNGMSPYFLSVGINHLRCNLSSCSVMVICHHFNAAWGTPALWHV